MRAKKKAIITMKTTLIVIFGVIAELHKSFSQQIFAIIELALNYKMKNLVFLFSLLKKIEFT
jgi:hypothetical protein